LLNVFDSTATGDMFVAGAHSKHANTIWVRG